MKSHKYKTGRRIMNWRVGVLSIGILWCAVVGSYADKDNVYVREPQVFLAPVIVEHPKDESIETKIRKHFPRSHKTVIAIAKAESNMKIDAVGYNCYYSGGKATTTPIKGGSKACKVEDRHLAWSRDCGILQINTTAKVCPKETIDEHLARGAELSRIQGLDAWVTHWNGDYQKHLASN